jgi:general secretion pathway protein D
MKTALLPLPLLLTLSTVALAEGDGAAQADETEKSQDPDNPEVKKPKPRPVTSQRMSPTNAALVGPKAAADRARSDKADKADKAAANAAANAADNAADKSNAAPTPGDAPASSTAAAATAAPGGDETKAAVKHMQAPFPPNMKFSLDYDNVELKDLVKDFAEKTQRNFLVDPKISGKITIISPVMVTLDEAYEAFIAALDANGFTTVVLLRDKNGKAILTRILDAKEASTEPIGIYKDGSGPKGTSQLITRLVKVENVSVDEISKVVSKMVSGMGDMVAYAPSNMLIITDSAINIERMLTLIRELDISAPKQKLEVIAVRYAEAAKIVDIINQLYGTAEKGAPKAPASSASKSSAAARRAGKDAAPAGAELTSVGDDQAFIGKLIADERTNAIIALATEKALGEMKDLIRQLDYEVDPAAQADIQVVYLEHAKAEELSQTLNSLIQTSNQRQNQRRTTGNAANSERSSSRAAAEESRPNLPGGVPGDLGGNFAGEVRITHDEPTNSLVITAGRDDYRRLRRVISMLDIARRQVFVETVIMEVSDMTKKDSGASWHGGIPGKGENPVNAVFGHGTDSLNLSSLVTGGLLSGIATGIFGQAIELPIPGPNGTNISIPAFGVVLHALQEDTSANVLSTPNILTMDNEEASIEVGETVPFPTGSAMGGLGSLSSAASAAGISIPSSFSGFPSLSYTREDVGIILRITPQVGENDNVILDVYQEISEVKEGSASANGGGGPTTTKRSAETHVAVGSNQTIVIGGLMQEVETENESKVPVLGDIPLIGALFRSKAKTKRKTNLLIFLTPHVIDGPADLQEIYGIKMLQRQEFLRRFYGKSKEEQAKELDALIKYSMNVPGQPSVYRDRPTPEPAEQPVDDEALRRAILESGGEMIGPGTPAEEPAQSAPPAEGTPPSSGSESSPALPLPPAEGDGGGGGTGTQGGGP